MIVRNATRHSLLVAATAGAAAASVLVVAPGAHAQVGTFSQLSATTINASGPATPYPSSIGVSGLPRGVTDVNVTLTGFSHGSPEEVDVLLVGPTGQAVTLLSDVGGAANAVTDRNFTLDEQALASLPDSTTLASGTFKPTDFEPGDPYGAPGPVSGPMTSALANFNSTDPNGVWSLFVVDAGGMAAGSIDSWSIQITTVDTPGAPIISTPTNGLDSDGDFIVAGTAQAGSTVKVYEGTTLLSETTTSATGTWALVLLDQEHRVHAYTATATDAFGNVSAASAVKTVAVDTEHPRVIRTKPGAGADEVRRGRNVRAFFSEPVRSVTIVGANVKLVRSATGATVRARIRYDADTKSVIINPRNDLAANARYQVVVGTGVRDRAGNRLDQNTARSGNQAKTWRFTTR
ncbi:MAG TPA: Ig-like domain-containing protein [Actinomycetes bacterium]|nr:Ig-like domain-containing protein [Actinomycetes bacterium]